MNVEKPAVWLATIAGLILSAWTIGDALTWAATHQLSDLNVFALAGQRFSLHEPYYRAQESAAFIYPPVTAALFSLLPADSPALRIGWTLCAYILPLGIISGYLIRHLAPHMRRKTLLIVAAISTGLLLHTQVVTYGMTMGQTDCLMLLLVVLDFFALPPRLRGTLIGLATGLKLTAAIFLIIPLCQSLTRRTLRPVWDVARAGAVFALTVGAGLMGPGQLAASSQYWLSYSEQINHAFPQIVGYQDNKSLSALIARAWPNTSPTTEHLVCAAVAAAGLVLCVRLIQLRHLLLAVATAGQLYCLCATFTGTRHWAPTLLWVFALWQLAARLHRPRLACLGLGLWALMQFGQNSLSGVFAPTVGDYPFTDIPAIAGVLLLAVVAAASFRSVPEQAHGEPGSPTPHRHLLRAQYPQSVPQTRREHKSPAPQKTPSPAAP